MSALSEIRAGALDTKPCRPWPHAVVSAETWNLAGQHLAAGRLALLGLWGEIDAVHMALLNEQPLEIGIVTTESKRGEFPSIGAVHAPAIRLERTVHDLYGLRPVGLPDTRPWLDHGRWGVQQPLAVQANMSPQPSDPYPFLPAE